MRFMLALVCLMLIMTLAPRTATAQARLPGNPLCDPPDPGRAISLALDDPQVIVAVVDPEGGFTPAEGIQVNIVEVVEGEFAAGTATADVRPTLECVANRAWEPGGEVIGAFLVAGEGQLVTLASWPFVDGMAQLDDGRALTPDGLLELGRSFVEPTPTPLPEGVPPPPTIEPPDSGTDAAPTIASDTITAPSTGHGSTGEPAPPLAATIVAAVGVAAVTFGVCARRSI